MRNKLMKQNTAVVLTSESRLAQASVAVVSIQTGAVVQARIRLALILLPLTVLPFPARCALTDVAMHNARSHNVLM